MTTSIPLILQIEIDNSLKSNNVYRSCKTLKSEVQYRSEMAVRSMLINEVRRHTSKIIEMCQNNDEINEIKEIVNTYQTQLINVVTRTRNPPPPPPLPCEFTTDEYNKTILDEYNKTINCLEDERLKGRHLRKHLKDLVKQHKESPIEFHALYRIGKSYETDYNFQSARKYYYKSWQSARQQSKTRPEIASHLANAIAQDQDDVYHFDDKCVLSYLKNAYSVATLSEHKGIRLVWYQQNELKQQLIEASKCCLMLGLHHCNSEYNDASLCWFKRAINLLTKCVISLSDDTADEYTADIAQTLCSSYQNNIMERFRNKHYTISNSTHTDPCFVGYQCTKNGDEFVVYLQNELRQMMDINIHCFESQEDSESIVDLCANYAQFLCHVQHNYDEAEEWVQKGMELDASDSIHSNLADIYEEIKRLKHANDDEYDKNMDKNQNLKQIQNLVDLQEILCSDSEDEDIKEANDPSTCDPSEHIDASSQRGTLNIFWGLNETERNQIKIIMTQRREDYKKHMTHHRKVEQDEIIKRIKMYLRVDIDTEKAEFIRSYTAKNNMNWEARVQEEGVFFLQSIQEMMDQNVNVSDMECMMGFDDDDRYEETESEEDATSDEEYVPMMSCNYNACSKRKKKTNCDLQTQKKKPNLKLNAASTTIDKMTALGWNKVKQNAFVDRINQANKFYYRHNASAIVENDDEQLNMIKDTGGTWTESESKQFMTNILTYGVNDNWGLFSKNLSRRVGYTMSNKWRSLIKKGWVEDRNYSDGGFKHTRCTKYRKFAFVVLKDPTGVWTNLPKKHPKHPCEDECQKIEKEISRKKGRKRTMKDGDKNCAKPRKKKRKLNKKKRTEREYLENDHDTMDFIDTNIEDDVLPNFVDTITKLKVTKPAICPYGFVLSYGTWQKMLAKPQTKNICPFTQRHMTRRSLVKLTHDNIAMYKPTIKNGK
eukprot:960850_1